MRIWIVVIVLISIGSMAAAKDGPVGGVTTEAAPVQKFLNDGDLDGAEKAMVMALGANPRDDQARVALGVVQVFQAVQGTGRSLYSHGVRSKMLQGSGIPFLRLPMAENPNPRTPSYETVRQMVQDAVTQLSKAEATLAGVKDPAVKLPLRVGLIKLDLTGTAGAGQGTELWSILASAQRGRVVGAAADKDMLVVLDMGDIQWLRGYCHLLVAMGDFILGYDERDLFNSTGQLVFRKIDSPRGFLAGDKAIFKVSDFDVADAIAGIHLINFPVADRNKLAEARTHLKEVAACSRRSWEAIRAETDDDYEWIPNPGQHSVMQNMVVTDEMIRGWLTFMDEFDSLLDGKVLIPFWRGREDDGMGVNLRKVFTEPQPFDLVLWVQGSAAGPFLEKGKMTNTDVYRNLERVFQGNLFGFAIWFN